MASPAASIADRTSAHVLIPVEEPRNFRNPKHSDRFETAFKRFLVGYIITSSAAVFTFVLNNKEIVDFATSHDIPYIKETLTVGVVALGILGGGATAFIGDRCYNKSLS